MPNLIEGLNTELERNRELLGVYESIPTGAFGALVIQQAITAAESAMASGDIVEMVRAYKGLKDTK